VQTQEKSDRTIQKHKRAKMQMEAKGFLLFSEFFKQKAEREKWQESIEANARTAEVVTVSEDVPEAFTAPSTASDVEEEVEVSSVVSETAVSAVVLPVEEEEEEEEEGGSETGNTTTAMHSLSRNDLGNFRQTSWGPSWTILYKSKESTSSDGSNTSSNLKNLEGTDTWELGGLCHRNTPNDASPQWPMASAPELLWDHVGLLAAQKEISCLAMQKLLDTILQGCVVGMVSMLKLYMDKSLRYTWKMASEIAAKSEGHGTTWARSIRSWVLHFVYTKDLPTHKLGGMKAMVLDDKDVTQELKLALSERAKNGFLMESNIIDIISSPKMQAHFV
jgi:hypothetical protein